MNARSRSDIMEAIMRVIARGDGRGMRIMYGAYVSYEQLEEYARYMINQQLVYIEHGSELYKLTPKGEEFLRLAEQAIAGPIVET